MAPSIWAPRTLKTTKLLELCFPPCGAQQRREQALSPSQKESQVQASWTPGVYLWLRLARPCIHLPWLAMTWAHFSQNQFSPFDHPTQANTIWVTSINLLLTNEIQEMSALKWSFANFVYLWGKLPSVWPPNASLYASSTCRYLRLLQCESVWPGLYSPWSLRPCSWCSTFQINTTDIYETTIVDDWLLRTNPSDHRHSLTRNHFAT